MSFRVLFGAAKWESFPSVGRHLALSVGLLSFDLANSAIAFGKTTPTLTVAT